jgi:hypothetical protein
MPTFTFKIETTSGKNMNVIMEKMKIKQESGKKAASIMIH